MADDYKEFNKLFAETLGYEGGVDQTMEGVVSNMGVTQTAYDAYNKKNSLPTKDVKEISFPEGRDIALEEYFKAPKLDKIQDKSLQGAMFDYEYNSGGRQSVKAVQEIVGTKADGLIGKKTLKAINKYIEENGSQALVGELLSQREQFLTNLTISNPQKYGKYLKGWINRIGKQRAKYLQQPKAEGNPQEGDRNAR